MNLCTPAEANQIRATFAPLLRKCTKYRALAEGQRIHSILHNTGQDRHTFLSNLLVQMYGSCGRLQEAREVFNNMYDRNIYSWNIMLVAYTQNGHLQEAKKVFDTMPDPDLIAYNTIVLAYARTGNLNKARGLFDNMRNRDVVSWNTILTGYAQHGDMQTAWFLFSCMPSWSTVSWNSLITGYTHNGELREARKIFNAMSERDVVSWTAVIVANTQGGYCREALELFQLMDLEGVSPNAFTFTSALDACEWYSTGKLMHSELVACGYQHETNIGNALVSMYTRMGRIECAKEIFDSMPTRDIVTWTSIATGYAKAGKLKEARGSFEKAPQTDVVSWTALMNAFFQSGYLHAGESLFHMIPQRNVVTWNTMISAYAQVGHNRKALKLFKMMDLEGTQPDKVSFIVTLQACTSLLEGRVLHSLLREQTFGHDPEVVTCLIHLYGTCGSISYARSIFDKHILPLADVVPWNAMVTAYVQFGHLQLTLELFELMLLQGVQPNEITSVGIITACSRAGTLRDGRYYFQSLVVDFRIKPVIDHFICILDLLGRAGLLELAEDLVKNMPFECDGAVWLAFLSACKIHGDFKRASCAAQELVKFESATAAPYLLLSNTFSK